VSEEDIVSERITAEQVQSDVESYALRASPDGRRRVIREALDKARREGGEDAAAEVARLRKLFDDAGEGTYDVLALVDHYQADAMRMFAEVARLRSVLGSIATLDESDTDDLLEALTNWDVADVYASLRAAITSARMALDDAAKGAGR
jgi:hypothetical protein